jgi:hypothetical protein
MEGASAMSEDHPEFEAPAPDDVVTPALVTPPPPVVEEERVATPVVEEPAETKVEQKVTGVKSLRVLSLLVMIAGVLLIAAGAITWFVVADQLGDEHIVVSDDAAHFAGSDVQDPFTAYAQANTIKKHALEASDGKTYAQLAQDDPVRQTVMTASFLRASLFTSVVSFGVAVFAAAMGVLMIVVGYVLRRLSGLVGPVRVEPATT